MSKYLKCNVSTSPARLLLLACLLSLYSCAFTLEKLCTAISKGIFEYNPDTFERIGNWTSEKGHITLNYKESTSVTTIYATYKPNQEKLLVYSPTNNEIIGTGDRVLIVSPKNPVTFPIFKAPTSTRSPGGSLTKIVAYMNKIFDENPKSIQFPADFGEILMTEFTDPFTLVDLAALVDHTTVKLRQEAAPSLFAGEDPYNAAEDIAKFKKNMNSRAQTAMETMKEAFQYLPDQKEQYDNQIKTIEAILVMFLEKFDSIELMNAGIVQAKRACMMEALDEADNSDKNLIFEAMRYIYSINGAKISLFDSLMIKPIKIFKEYLFLKIRENRHPPEGLAASKVWGILAELQKECTTIKRKFTVQNDKEYNVFENYTEQFIDETYFDVMKHLVWPTDTMEIELSILFDEYWLKSVSNNDGGALFSTEVINDGKCNINGINDVLLMLGRAPTYLVKGTSGKAVDMKALFGSDVLLI